MYCEKCGTKLEENSKFCEKCGAKIEDEATEKITPQTPPAQISPVESEIIISESFKEKPEIVPAGTQDEKKKSTIKNKIMAVLAIIAFLCLGLLISYGRAYLAILETFNDAGMTANIPNFVLVPMIISGIVLILAAIILICCNKEGNGIEVKRNKGMSKIAITICIILIAVIVSMIIILPYIICEKFDEWYAELQSNHEEFDWNKLYYDNLYGSYDNNDEIDEAIEKAMVALIKDEIITPRSSSEAKDFKIQQELKRLKILSDDMTDEQKAEIIEKAKSQLELGLANFVETTTKPTEVITETTEEPTTELIESGSVLENLNSYYEDYPAYYLETIKDGTDTGMKPYFKIHRFKFEDTNSLIIIVVVPDTTQYGNSPTVRFNDSIEIALDLDYERTSTYSGENQLNISFIPYIDQAILGNSEVRGDGNGKWSEGGIWYFVDYDDTGYVYTIEVDLSSIPRFQGDGNNVIGINVQVNDNAHDNEARDCCYSWRDAEDEVWHNPSAMGAIYLYQDGRSREYFPDNYGFGLSIEEIEDQQKNTLETKPENWVEAIGFENFAPYNSYGDWLMRVMDENGRYIFFRFYEYHITPIQYSRVEMIRGQIGESQQSFDYDKWMKDFSDLKLESQVRGDSKYYENLKSCECPTLLNFYSNGIEVIYDMVNETSHLVFSDGSYDSAAITNPDVNNLIKPYSLYNWMNGGSNGPVYSLYKTADELNLSSNDFRQIFLPDEELAIICRAKYLESGNYLYVRKYKDNDEWYIDSEMADDLFNTAYDDSFDVDTFMASTRGFHYVFLSKSDVEQEDKNNITVMLIDGNTWQSRDYKPLYNKYGY